MTMSLDRKKKDRVPGQLSIKNVFHRKEQLDNWKDSPTARESAVFKLIPQVTFDTSTSFLAACADGDIEDAENLLKKGADINSTNIDKMTALHQACIDCNLDVIELLLSNGCDVNVQDVEGWTPLHAAASCALPEVVELLLQWGADPGLTNNDNDLAQDLADDEETSDLLSRAAHSQGLNLDSARDVERAAMMKDAVRWRHEGYPAHLPLDPFYSASPLHVAAAKGYLDVLQQLLACPGINVEAKDADGWTPLHAAAHWGQKEAARILCEAGSHIDTLAADGLSPCDVADPEHAPYMRQLKEKFGVRLRKETGKHHEIRHTMARRSSVIRISTDQKSLTRNQKEPSPMVMMFSNMMLKKTLKGLMPRDNVEMPTTRAQARVAEHRQKILSMMEIKDDHDSADCCLHRRSTPVAPMDEGKENDARLSFIDEEERRESGVDSPEAVFGEARRLRRSGQVERVSVVADRDSVRSEMSRHSGMSQASRITLPSDSSLTSQSESSEYVSQTSASAPIPDTNRTSQLSETNRPSTTSEISRVSMTSEMRDYQIPETNRPSTTSEISRVSLTSEMNRDSQIPETNRASRYSDSNKDSQLSETNRPSTTSEISRVSISSDSNTASQGTELTSSSVSADSVFTSGQEAVNTVETGSVSDETRPSRPPRGGLVQRAVSRWSETVENNNTAAQRPWVPLRRLQILSDAGTTRERTPREDSPRRKLALSLARISSVLSPHKSDMSETQRMVKSRNALADRRSTQGEVFDSESEGADNPFDEPAQDWRARCEAAEREAQTLRDQLAQTAMETEVAAKTQERQRQIEALERENAALRHQKALDDLRAENHRLKEENASLLRVISKMSLRGKDS